MDLNEIIINNPSFGKVNGSKIYLTSELNVKLSKEKTKDGTLIIELLRTGRALQGLKHLIETLQQREPHCRIVFTHEKSKVEDREYHVNYQAYRQLTKGRFFELYRQTGLDAAGLFVNLYLKRAGEKSTPEVVTAGQMMKIDRQFPEVLSKLSHKLRNKRALISETTKVVEGLRTEKRSLLRDIEGLKRLQQQSSIYLYQQAKDEMIRRMGKKYPETKGRNSWQSWIYKNNWLFGVHYQTPIEKEKIGFDSIPDYLFPTLDGFLDILEIKRPDHEVIKQDDSHPRSYMWTSKTNEAIGQSVNYIHEIELHQLEIKQRIEREYKQIYKSGIFTIKPRAFILIGDSSQWDEEKREALRKLNYSLHGIEVLTYTDLIHRAEKIIEMYVDGTQ